MTTPKKTLMTDPTTGKTVVKVEPVPAEASIPAAEGKAKKAKKERKAKSAEPNSAVFPREGKINKYGFLFIDQHVQAAMGITCDKTRDFPVEINLQPDGTLTVRLV